MSSKPPLTEETIPETGPLSAAQCMTLCAGCQRCCTYVAVEVDAPDVPWMYDQYVWLLYHKGIWMYVEKGNKWFVQFETVCEKLGARGECRVHGSHPVLCKEYDARTCERRGELSDVVARFFDGDDLVRWLEVKRPVHHRRYRAWFDAAHAPQPPAANGQPAPRVRYEMPPPPVSPLLLARRPLPAPDKVAYRKSTNGNGHPVKGGRKVPVG
jgi:hypothetical protein